MKTHNKKMCSHSKCDKKKKKSIAEGMLGICDWPNSLCFAMLGKEFAFSSSRVRLNTDSEKFHSPPSFYFFFLFKHGVNRIPWRVCWTGHECTAHKLESIQRGRCWRAAEGTDCGSTWLFPLPSVIRYTSLLLQQRSLLVVWDLMQLSSQVVFFSHLNAYKSFVKWTKEKKKI